MKSKTHGARGIVDVRGAAAIMDIDPLSVYRAIWDKRLYASKAGGHWLITRSAISRFAKHRRKK